MDNFLAELDIPSRCDTYGKAVGFKQDHGTMEGYHQLLERDPRV
jgi:hypothetical protein